MNIIIIFIIIAVITGLSKMGKQAQQNTTQSGGAAPGDGRKPPAYQQEGRTNNQTPTAAPNAAPRASSTEGRSIPSSIGGARRCTRCGMIAKNPQQAFCEICGAQLPLPIQQRQSSTPQQRKPAHKQQPMRPTPQRSADSTLKPSNMHTVTASVTGNNHTHMETSMTGFTECGEANAVIKAETPGSVATPKVKALIGNRDELIRGIVLSEVLGKPRAMQRYGR